MMNRRKRAIETILSPVKTVIIIPEFRAALRKTKLSVSAPLTVASLVSATKLTI